jgi:hypothetical protein
MVKDIDLTDSLELNILNGDFVIAESDQNHIVNICKANIGCYKQFPLLGVGIDQYIASAGTSLILKRNISINLESDSFKVNEIKVVENDNYYIDAIRIENGN